MKDPTKMQTASSLTWLVGVLCLVFGSQPIGTITGVFCITIGAWYNGESTKRQD